MNNDYEVYKMKISRLINYCVLIIMIILLIYMFSLYLFYYDDSIEKLNIIKYL